MKARKKGMRKVTIPPPPEHTGPREIRGKPYSAFFGQMLGPTWATDGSYWVQEWYIVGPGRFTVKTTWSEEDARKQVAKMNKAAREEAKVKRQRGN